MMNTPMRCPRCGAPVQPHFRACPQCATPLGAPYPPAAPMPGGPAMVPPGPYAPPSGQAYPPPPGAQQAPSAYDPMNPMAGMPRAAPQPPATNKGTALLGGCGAAGCLGGAVAVVIAVAVVFLAVIAASSSSTTDTGPEPASTGGPVIASNLPNHGPLRSLVRNRVGPYGLVTTASVTKYPELLTSGMVDSLGVIYLTPDGSQLNEMILAYTSAQVARGHMDTVLAAFQATYGPNAGIVMEPIRNQSNVVIGARVVVNEPGGLQHVYWSNSNVLFIVTAPAPHAARFHEASPY